MCPHHLLVVHQYAAELDQHLTPLAASNDMTGTQIRQRSTPVLKGQSCNRNSLKNRI